MKEFKLILAIILLALIGVAVLFFLPDEELSETAIKWLEQPVDHNPKTNIFNGLQGLNAPEGTNIIQAGISKTAKENQLIADFRDEYGWQEVNNDTFFEQENELNKHSIKPTLNLQDLCRPDTENCIDYWKSNRDKLNQYTIENKVLLERKEQLSALSTYTTTASPDILYIAPNYVSYGIITSLKSNKDASDFLETNKNIFLDKLNNEISFNKIMLAETDSLIAKMIAVAYVRRSIHTLSQLVDEVENSKEFKEIPNLTQDQIDFKNVFESEFRFQSVYLNMLIESPDNIIASEIDSPLLTKFLNKYGFKKNHYLNKQYIDINTAISMSQKTGVDYFQSLQTPSKSSLSFIDYITNPQGAILINVSEIESFYSYISRVHDLNGLITLYNLKLNILSNKSNINDINQYLQSKADTFFDPYRNEAIKYNAETKELYFDSPDEESQANKLHLDIGL